METYFTISRSFESLLLEEQTVSQEISAFDRKVDSWQSIPRATHMKTTEAAAALAAVGGPPKLTSSSSMPPAVMAFEVRMHGLKKGLFVHLSLLSEVSPTDWRSARRLGRLRPQDFPQD